LHRPERDAFSLLSSVVEDGRVLRSGASLSSFFSEKDRMYGSSGTDLRLPLFFSISCRGVKIKSLFFHPPPTLSSLARRVRDSSGSRRVRVSICPLFRGKRRSRVRGRLLFPSFQWGVRLTSRLPLLFFSMVGRIFLLSSFFGCREVEDFFRWMHSFNFTPRTS